MMSPVSSTNLVQLMWKPTGASEAYIGGMLLGRAPTY